MHLGNYYTNELTVRESPDSDGLTQNVEIDRWVVGGTDEDIWIMIHGYNVDLYGARKGYNRFIGHLAGQRIFTETNAWKFYWPSNKSNSLESVFSFNEQVKNAENAADRLARFISRKTACKTPLPRIIRVVAHSLGCRLFLFLLKRLNTIDPQKKIEFGNVHFMAAAVQVNYLKDMANLNLFRLRCLERFSLHSPIDGILPFLPFFELTGGRGFHSAVGQLGHPNDAWTKHSTNTWLLHTQYWSSVRSAHLVAKDMGRPVPHEIGSHQLYERRLSFIDSVRFFYL